MCNLCAEFFVRLFGVFIGVVVAAKIAHPRLHQTESESVRIEAQ